MLVLLWDTVNDTRLPSSHPVLHTSHLLRDSNDSASASWDAKAPCAAIRTPPHGRDPIPHRISNPSTTQDPVLRCCPHHSRVSTGNRISWSVDLVRRILEEGWIRRLGNGVFGTITVSGHWEWIMCFRALETFRMQRGYCEYRGPLGRIQYADLLSSLVIIITR
ncbi:hypothetical protein M413DRAFT_190648 [Hebeloma cylindrosporum]|uniref:Uncharacterized protein n=1 Tax=Hebeloma cylindrosporum TaxID=76867 RepID=A0A0C3C569_HEBCY|nr:hypothetical protein M413DRAFT_190648 [Hebeloma cylindrosporum h7]